MKYIKTTKGIWEIEKLTKKDYEWLQKGENKQADTIEELFDEVVFYDLEEECMQILSPSFSKWSILNDLKDGRIKDNNIFGAIWTDKGLIFKAKMKGVSPNGEIDWELL